MRRKAWTVAAIVALVAAIGVVVAASREQPATQAGEETVPSTATVERGALSTRVSRAGFLTHRARSDGLPLPVINRASGTYTALPDLGAEIPCGEVLYRVDDAPVLLLCGPVPAYRDLHRGDAGNDVHQLSQNLHALGYDADAEAHVFNDKTESALRALQLTKGSQVDGVLGVADVVVLPWSVQIAAVIGELGAPSQPGAAILRVTSDALEVQLELNASERGAVQPGDTASITLPGNTSATGTVDRLGRIAKAPEGPDADPGAATIGAYISLDRPADASGLDKAPVQVEITTNGVDDALSVPVTAIFGNAGGGFAVEVVRDGGRRDLVTVELGLVDTAAGRVQVDGEIRAGDRVVVPPS